MAFNWQTFRTRALTAILFAAIMLAGLLWNPWSFFILFSIIHFGCWVEYQRLVEGIDPGYRERTPFHKYGVMLAGWCLMLWFSGEAFLIGEFGLHEAGWWMGLILAFLLPVTEVLFTKSIRPKNIAHSFFGLVYISLSWGLFMDLYNHIEIKVDGQVHQIDPRVIPITIVASIWINDTMAYIVGSLIGKTPLTPISPRKTWEGTLGGIVLSIAVVGLLVYFVFNRPYLLVHALAIAGISAITGTLGDLLESKLKRLAGVKDSGTLMPGHGGFLDRFDSLLIAIPFVWLYTAIFIK
jgi:CDP-diglyceride synthetase